ncbi:short-chain oxidoreductase [Candidatus Berkelbacteria bacterium]|nr:short-chain oxidoreductase [Candidatus Berkelbacteria bacterium]
MHLEKLQPGVELYISLERYLGGGTRTYSQFSATTDTPTQYLPNGPETGFRLPCFTIPQSHPQVMIYTAEPDPLLTAAYLPDQTVIFPVHPALLGDQEIAYLADIEKFASDTSLFVAPSASIRTVMPLDTSLPFHFLKLHYPRRISRFLRRLRQRGIDFYLMVTRDLADWNAPSEFAYFPETLGITFGDYEEGWGYVVREGIPRPIINSSSVIIPFFALYGQDLRAPQDPPLIVQLIRQLGAQPKEFVLTKIILPTVDCWIRAARERGILFGSHAQNTLLELTANLQPSRIIHRDFDLRIDPVFRTMQNLPIPFKKNVLGADIHEPRERVYSLIYDAYMGHHLFDYLTRTVGEWFGVAAHHIESATRDYFREHFYDYKKVFDDQTYYYTNEILPNNRSQLVPTGQPPRWR